MNKQRKVFSEAPIVQTPSPIVQFIRLTISRVSGFRQDTSTDSAIGEGKHARWRHRWKHHFAQRQGGFALNGGTELPKAQAKAMLLATGPVLPAP